MFRPNPQRSPNPRRSDTRSAMGTAALLLVPVACYAGPALLGAASLTAALGAIGTWLLSPWLLSPWLLAAAGLLALAALGWRLRARRNSCITPTCGPPQHRPTQSVDTDRSPIQHQER